MTLEDFESGRCIDHLLMCSAQEWAAENDKFYEPEEWPSLIADYLTSTPPNRATTGEEAETSHE